MYVEQMVLYQKVKEYANLDNYVFGSTTRVAAGFVVSEYFSSLNTNIRQYQIDKNPTNNHLFFSPEIPIGQTS